MRYALGIPSAKSVEDSSKLRGQAVAIIMRNKKTTIPDWGLLVS